MNLSSIYKGNVPEWCCLLTRKYKDGYIHTKHNSIGHYDTFEAQYKDTVVYTKSEHSAKLWITKQMKGAIK